ncbi:hypothetical protein [Planktothricoides sp. SR001]|uniref:hypothetical protein n=1 Tax=Planktothricoides sp. SR001 TaxID=1705388 RepID=UPI001E50BE88|nr:hypothetical protein [Planktothricoides sp. SR001]
MVPSDVFPNFRESNAPEFGQSATALNANHPLCTANFSRCGADCGAIMVQRQKGCE